MAVCVSADQYGVRVCSATRATSAVPIISWSAARGEEYKQQDLDTEAYLFEVTSLRIC